MNQTIPLFQYEIENKNTEIEVFYKELESYKVEVKDTYIKFVENDI